MKTRKNDSTLDSFKMVVQTLPNKHIMIFVVVLTMCSAVLQVYFAHLLRIMLDAVFTQQWADFTFAIRMLLALAGIEVVTRYVRQRMIGRYSEGGVAYLRSKLAHHLSYLPIAQFGEKHSGDYVSRLTNDVEKLRQFTTSTLIQFAFQPLAALAALAYLLSINWKLTVVSVLATPVLLVGATVLSKPMTKYSREAQEKLAEVNSVAQDTLAGAEVARAFTLNSTLAGQYNLAVDQAVQSRRQVASRQAIMTVFQLGFSFAPYLLMLTLGGYWVLQGEMTGGAIAAFLNLMSNLTFPLAELPALIGRSRDQLAGATRLWDLLKFNRERVTGQVLSGEEGAPVVACRNLTFSYTEGEDGEVLDNCTFSIQPGETVALVGSSGSGKTTLLKILLGYYENYKGDVALFGHDMANWQLDGLRSQIAWVGQDTFLFPGSIKENIGYGRIGASEEEVVMAAKVANAHDFILALPQEYETPVGELGGQLSGGQKQRLAIARAILKDAPLLLLDEATSALDTQSEVKLKEALDTFMQHRTALVIAHRLSTITGADRVLVMDKGRIVQQGSHETLLAQAGLYRSLYLREFVGKETPTQEVI